MKGKRKEDNNNDIFLFFVLRRIFQSCFCSLGERLSILNSVSSVCSLSTVYNYTECYPSKVQSRGSFKVWERWKRKSTEKQHKCSISIIFGHSSLPEASFSLAKNAFYFTQTYLPNLLVTDLFKDKVDNKETTILWW